MRWRVGVDSGGTFTDICLFNEATGEVIVWKSPSTPDDPSMGIANVVTQGLERAGASLSDVTFFGHGTTVATNALIEMRGAASGLLTTTGFRDLLEIGRQKRPDLYDMFANKPPLVVARDNRLEVAERLNFDGSVSLPLDFEDLRSKVQTLKENQVDAVAICFLYSFLNSQHEEQAADLVKAELPNAFVSVSHEVAPEFREFERLSTTVINAFLGPIMQRYITRLSERLEEDGLQVAPRLTQSNGGVIGFDAAAKFPVRTLLSGPSTGVVAAQRISELAGIENIITFDVGGTSSDVALLERGKCHKTGEAEVHGYPIKAPMLDIHTVGAGGGSIAYVDSGGLLKVGPESAGAVPGPVSYGLGGKKPTLTDANVVLRTLNPKEFLGGRMKVSRDDAVAAIQALSDELGLSLFETAQGIVSVATANMAKAIRVISVQRGHDPRDYALMAFGGGGPLHAARLARELEMSKVIVPPSPGALCAMGLMMTDLKSDFSQSLFARLSDVTPAKLQSGASSLGGHAEEWFSAENISVQNRIVNLSADLRFEGQNYELNVLIAGNELGTETISELRSGFEAAHEKRYGFAPEGEEIEFVTLRLEAVGLVPKTEPKAHEQAENRPPLEPLERRRVYMPEHGGEVECPVYSRESLRPGHCLSGPAIVEQMDTTTVVLPEMVGVVDKHLNLILEFSHAER